MLIEIENTYHPNMRNFYFEAPEQISIPVSYTDQDDMGQGLTQILKGITGIRRILLLQNLLFIEKDEDADWALLTPQITAELSDYHFENRSQDSLDDNQKKKIIESLIESQIRSYLVRDGGNLSMTGFQDGVVYVRLEGHCKGCPHAQMTIKNIVESILKKYLLFVTSVEREAENA